MVYKVVREFNELSAAEIMQHSTEVREAKDKEMAAWQELGVTAADL